MLRLAPLTNVEQGYCRKSVGRGEVYLSQGECSKSCFSKVLFGIVEQSPPPATNGLARRSFLTTSSSRD